MKYLRNYREKMGITIESQMKLHKIKRVKDKANKSTIKRRYEQARNIVEEALKDDLDAMVDFKTKDEIEEGKNDKKLGSRVCWDIMLESDLTNIQWDAVRSGLKENGLDKIVTSRSIGNIRRAEKRAAMRAIQLIARGNAGVEANLVKVVEWIIIVSGTPLEKIEFKVALDGRQCSLEEIMVGITPIGLEGLNSQSVTSVFPLSIYAGKEKGELVRASLDGLNHQWKRLIEQKFIVLKNCNSSDNSNNNNNSSSNNRNKSNQDRRIGLDFKLGCDLKMLWILLDFGGFNNPECCCYCSVKSKASRNDFSENAAWQTWSRTKFGDNAVLKAEGRYIIICALHMRFRIVEHFQQLLTAALLKNEDETTDLLPLVELCKSFEARYKFQKREGKSWKVTCSRGGDCQTVLDNIEKFCALWPENSSRLDFSNHLLADLRAAIEELEENPRGMNRT